MDRRAAGRCREEGDGLSGNKGAAHGPGGGTETLSCLPEMAQEGPLQGTLVPERVGTRVGSQHPHTEGRSEDSTARTPFLPPWFLLPV